MKFLPLFLFTSMLSIVSCSKGEDFYRKQNVDVSGTEESIEIALPGENSQKEIIDNFVQKNNSNKKVDILWVIDNSRSMADEQESLASNFEMFINDFITKDIDFKMAVTTTDPTPSWSGYMIGNNPEALTAKKARDNRTAFIEDFKKTIKVGINGSPNEQGLNAIEAFMQRYSDTFIRKDATLIVVIVSDEEDSSPKKVSEYVKQLHALKQNHGQVKVYSIVDTDTYKAKEGPLLPFHACARYKEMSEATSGMLINIHKSFHSSLAQIGKSVIDLLDNFPLKATPIKGSLRVYVNEALSLENTYRIQKEGNLLIFKPKSIPEAGSKIRAEYLINVKTEN